MSMELLVCGCSPAEMQYECLGDVAAPSLLPHTRQVCFFSLLWPCPVALTDKNTRLVRDR